VNPLADNPAARKAVYSLFWFASLVLGAIGAGYGAAEGHSIPDWYSPAVAVFSFFAAGIGYTARINVSAAPVDTP
jgi:hypothetical protein